MFKLAVTSSAILDMYLFSSYIKDSSMLFNMLRLNQHLSNNGIKQTLNSLRIALFIYLGMQHSTGILAWLQEKMP